MRVLHVIPAVAPRYGGPSTAIGPLCQALNRLPGVRVELATTDADGPTRLTPADLPAGVPAHVFGGVRTESLKYSPALHRWLRQHARDYDLLHLHSLWTAPPALAAAAARRAGVPYIVRPAGMLSDYTFARGRLKKQLFWLLVERRTVAGAAAFHATSEQEAAEVRAVRPGAAVAVIDNGVGEDAWTTPADPGHLAGLCGPAAAGRPVVLFLSRLHPKKGLADLLLPAFAMLRTPAVLAIAGGADDSAPGYPSEVRQAVRRLGLADRVVLLGAVPPAERWRVLDGAAVFVLPSHQENFGIALAEAMARGRPVVVTDRVQAAPHVTAAGAGAVVSPDPAALAAALDGLLADLAGRAAAGARAAAYARERFGWDRVAGEVAALYRRCLGSGP